MILSLQKYDKKEGTFGFSKNITCDLENQSRKKPGIEKEVKKAEQTENKGNQFQNSGEL